MKKIEIKLARRMAQLELSKDEGADILIKDEAYKICGYTLEEVEAKYPDFKIWFRNGYYHVAEKEQTV